MNNIYDNVVNNVNDGILKQRRFFVGPMPYGIIWGLVLLKDLPKPPIPVGIFMPKTQRKNGQYLR